MKPYFLLVTLFFTTLFLTSILCVTVLVKTVQLDINCIGHLKRAASANNHLTAEDELKQALNYLEANDMTSGYTSIFYKTPDEDIGYWYQNIKDSHRELSKITDATSSLEISNILLKLRETLMEDKRGGNRIIVPQGLASFPNNTMYTIKLIIGLSISLILLIGIIKLNDSW